MNSRLFWIAIVFVCLCGSAHAGVLEICKVSDPLFSLSGLYSFTIAGQPGTVVAPADVCTAPFLLPDGNAVITEVPNPNSVFESVNTFPGDQLIGVDPLTASATVLIAPGNLSDPSTWLEVNFVNTPVPEPGTGWVVGLGLTVWALRTARSSPRRRRWRWQRSGAGDAYAA